MMKSKFIAFLIMAILIIKLPTTGMVIYLSAKDNYRVRHVFFSVNNGMWEKRRYRSYLTFKPPGTIKYFFRDFAGNDSQIEEVEWLDIRKRQGEDNGNN